MSLTLADTVSRFFSGHERFGRARTPRSGRTRGCTSRSLASVLGICQPPGQAVEKPHMPLALRPLAGSKGRSIEFALPYALGSALAWPNEAHISLAFRGESLTAFEGRCIPVGCVAPRLNIPRYSRSSRLAIRAPRPSRCDATVSPGTADIVDEKMAGDND